MAVNQDRMLRTVVAGSNFRDAFERLLSELYVLDDRARNDPKMDISSIRGELTTICGKFNIPFRTAVSDAAHLRDEYNHFKRNYRQNKKHAAAAARRRRAQGISPRIQPIPIENILDYSTPNYISPIPPSNNSSTSLTPDFQTIPGAPNKPPLPPGVPPEPSMDDPDAYVAWWDQYGKYLK